MHFNAKSIIMIKHFKYSRLLYQQIHKLLGIPIGPAEQVLELTRWKNWIINTCLNWAGTKIGNYDKLENLLLYTNKLDDHTFSHQSSYIPANKIVFFSFSVLVWKIDFFPLKHKMGIEMLQLKRWLYLESKTVNSGMLCKSIWKVIIRLQCIEDSATPSWWTDYFHINLRESRWQLSILQLSNEYWKP